MKTQTKMSASAMVIIALVLVAPRIYALETTRVSVDTANVQTNNNSFLPALNENGQFVAFHSFANNLVPGDTNAERDVFVRNRQTGETTRASVATGGIQANSLSRVGDLSNDGNLISFESEATNLVAGDTNAKTDIFVHDRGAVTTTRVSVATGPVQANGDSFNAALSGDGRFVAFESEATNLVAGDTNGVSDVFVHDRQTGTTTRVSLATGAVQANGGSFSPRLSVDGRFVVFESDATNLVAGDTNGDTDVFVHDRQTGETTRVSLATGAVQANGDSFLPDISADGRFVSFQSEATNLVAGDTNGFSDAFRHDRQTGTTLRVSVPTGGSPQSNEDSFEAVISGDGRFVAFLSYATNLVPGGTSGNGDVFVHDTQTNTTTQMSVSTAGIKGNDFSCNPAISQDGRIVGFFSDSNNLVLGDTNGARDIFTRDRTVLFDLDLDGKADLVWQNSGSGEVAVWLMNGASIASFGSPAVLPADWEFQGLGDVNGDGKADLVWRNTGSGTVAVWLMDGTSIASFGFPATLPADWEFQGLGDVDKDGKADIVWQNTISGTVAVWLMDGTSIVSVGFPATLPADWEFQELGDVDGDGKMDLVWRNTGSGTVAVWLMDGTSIVSVGFPGTVSTDWVIQDVGDVNSDGKADVIWQNTTSGTVVVWLMNGVSIGVVGFPGTLSADWVFRGLDDVDGDGRADVIWHNTNGTVAVWLMNGVSIGAAGFPGIVPTEWEIQIP